MHKVKQRRKPILIMTPCESYSLCIYKEHPLSTHAHPQLMEPET